ncbi:hypothetical protein B0H11DRAFT_1724740 [Mycena galericulata]|nr:hypothetical protein B0H11DRAFT_1724740 [Mycena galericulata]
MDPIRGDLKGLHLLRSKLPPSALTTGAGFSSLLAYMGTGQGSMTSQFLQNNDMLFSSLDQCVETFRSAEIYNELQGPANALCIENKQIYGQPSNFLGLHPTIKLDDESTRKLELEEKFGQYFSADLQRNWENFIGPIANQDPEYYEGERVPWGDIISFLRMQKLVGFGSGLTALQFANNMVFTSIADPASASPEALAQWIYSNKSYGAFEGLKRLGFVLPPNASASAVRSAFLCFYYWLDKHLSKEDKVTLHFNAIFVEQLLCKVPRWTKRLKDMAKVDLEKIAQKEFEEARTGWEQGKNLENPLLFPIPPCNDRQVFSEILASGLVSCLNFALLTPH